MNVLWLVLGGIFTAVEYVVASLLLMVTIVGIPFGMQTLKLAGLALWPFGKEVRTGVRSGGCLYVLMNVLWILLGGIWIALSHLVFMRITGAPPAVCGLIVNCQRQRNNRMKITWLNSLQGRQAARTTQRRPGGAGPLSCFR